MLVTFPCDGAKTNMIMNFVFWNVRGLADKTKRRMVRDICRECSVDIFCLEESKLNNPSANIISSLFGRFSFDMDIKDSCGGMGRDNRGDENDSPSDCYCKNRQILGFSDSLSPFR